MALSACTAATDREESPFASVAENIADKTVFKATGPIAVDFWTNSGGQRDRNFFFGLATAPAHAEDKLSDTWLDFAKSGKVAAWNNQENPEARLNFWTDPETEIRLAAATGITVYRLGVDWGRLVPNKPGSNLCQGICSAAVQDLEALAHYRKILKLIHQNKMKVMLTLFHHSLPKWAMEDGGWQNQSTADNFTQFSADVAKGLGDQVDYWVTFNEPETFSLLTYIAGTWPPASVNPLKAFIKNHLGRALDMIAAAHKATYRVIKESGSTAPIGIAALLTKQTAFSESEEGLSLAEFGTSWARSNLVYGFTDRVIDHLDFVGINYYAEEFLRGTTPPRGPNQILVSTRIGMGPVFVPWRQYSESGRAINPAGLYELLANFHARYNNSRQKSIPFIITENGIADQTDILRPKYLIEHLKAVDAARKQGVPVNGYIFWTLSDNWEWADGYCPKFGLVSVDRKNGLARTKRPSYDLFTQIATTGQITGDQVGLADTLITKNLAGGHVFSCRDHRNPLKGLDNPKQVPLNPAAPLSFEALRRDR